MNSSESFEVNKSGLKGEIEGGKATRSPSFASAKITAPELSDSTSIPSMGVLYSRLIVKLSRVDNRLSEI